MTSRDRSALLRTRSGYEGMLAPLPPSITCRHPPTRLVPGPKAHALPSFAAAPHPADRRDTLRPEADHPCAAAPAALDPSSSMTDVNLCPIVALPAHHGESDSSHFPRKMQYVDPFRKGSRVARTSRLRCERQRADEHVQKWRRGTSHRVRATAPMSSVSSPSMVHRSNSSETGRAPCRRRARLSARRSRASARPGQPRGPPGGGARALRAGARGERRRSSG